LDLQDNNTFISIKKTLFSSLEAPIIVIEFGSRILLIIEKY
jgi:hypothetical protein